MRDSARMRFLRFWNQWSLPAAIAIYTAFILCVGVALGRLSA